MSKKNEESLLSSWSRLKGPGILYITQLCVFSLQSSFLILASWSKGGGVVTALYQKGGVQWLEGGGESAHRRVRPATDGAGVHLGMLHCVRGQVHLQRGRVCVRPVTIVALEGFIFVVLPPVGLRKLGGMRMGAPDSALPPP